MTYVQWTGEKVREQGHRQVFFCLLRRCGHSDMGQIPHVISEREYRMEDPQENFTVYRIYCCIWDFTHIVFTRKSYSWAFRSFWILEIHVFHLEAKSWLHMCLHVLHSFLPWAAIFSSGCDNQQLATPVLESSSSWLALVTPGSRTKLCSATNLMKEYPVIDALCLNTTLQFKKWESSNNNQSLSAHVFKFSRYHSGSIDDWGHLLLTAVISMQWLAKPNVTARYYIMHGSAIGRGDLHYVQSMPQVNPKSHSFLCKISYSRNVHVSFSHADFQRHGYCVSKPVSSLMDLGQTVHIWKKNCFFWEWQADGNELMILLSPLHGPMLPPNYIQ